MDIIKALAEELNIGRHQARELIRAQNLSGPAVQNHAI